MYMCMYEIRRLRGASERVSEERLTHSHTQAMMNTWTETLGNHRICLLD
jgi:hypothetical protein